MVCNTDRRPAAELAHLDVLRDYHAAGVVFAGSGFEDAAEAAALPARGRRPAGARLGRGGARRARPRLPERARRQPRRCARSDEHLLSLGQQADRVVPGRRGCTPVPTGWRASERRSSAAGSDALVLPGGFEFEAGTAAAETLLAGGLPDAVLGVNDEVAIGVLTGLRRGGVDVPGRISVAGIDGTRPAQLVDLTTLSLPLHELGRDGRAGDPRGCGGRRRAAAPARAAGDHGDERAGLARRGSAASRRTASSMTAGRLQNAKRTSVRPASSSS